MGREILVYTPPGYSANKKYPVIYVLQLIVFCNSQHIFSIFYSV